MEEVILKGVGLAITAGWASFGLCVDCMCPGSACDPLTCTFCCCGMVPTGCGVPSLLAKLSSGEEDDEVVTHLLSLPYATSAAYCMPQLLLCCCQPCARTPAQAASVRAAIIAQGVIPAAVQALAAPGTMLGGLQVLEQYVAFDAAGAVAAGAVQAVRNVVAISKLDPAAVAAADNSFASGKALIAMLAASVFTTLAAMSTSSLDAPSRVALAQEASALLVPFSSRLPQFPWDQTKINQVATRYNNIITINNAVVLAGGSPVPLVLSNPKDMPLKVQCGPTHMVNTLAEPSVDGGSDTISGMYIVQPPLRIALGAVQTVIPVAQAMSPAGAA